MKIDILNLIVILMNSNLSNIENNNVDSWSIDALKEI